MASMFVYAGPVAPSFFVNPAGRFMEGYAIECPDGLAHADQSGRIQIYGGRLAVIRAVFRLGVGYRPRPVFIRTDQQ